MTQEEKANAYDKALERARIWQNHLYDTNDRDYADELNYIFPELAESKDGRIRKRLIDFFEDWRENRSHCWGIAVTDILDWLEKQGDTNETIDKDKLAEGVLRGAAITLITWIDYNAAEGNMCLSNMECKDIEDALVNGDWNKIYGYMKKKLEKQGEPKVDCPQNYQDMNHPNGCIVMEDFNGGEGFYKLNLDYLNKKQVEEIEEIVKTWNTKPNDDIIRECVGMALTDVPQSRFESYGTSLKECLTWLKKQGNIGLLKE